MTVRGIVWLVLTTVSGLLAAGVTVYGIYSSLSVDFQQDMLLTSSYCALPVLCFPVFLLVRPAVRSAALLVLFAIGYLGVYSALNWRTCYELGYCGSLWATVIETGRTPIALAFFGAALCRVLAEWVDDRTSGWARRR